MLVSKSLDSASAYCCEFLLHEGALHLLLAEEGPTLRTLNYSRQVAESRRGTILVPRASFHLGAHLTRLHRLVLPSAAARATGGGGGSASGERAAAQQQQQRTALLWTSTDGSLGFVSPLEESAFRRLDFLTTKMVTGLPHVCGLQPRAFRAMRVNARSNRELRNMVDANLLGRYVELSALEQQRLALQIGSTPRKVLAALEALGRGIP